MSSFARSLHCFSICQVLPGVYTVFQYVKFCPEFTQFFNDFCSVTICINEIRLNE